MRSYFYTYLTESGAVRPGCCRAEDDSGCYALLAERGIAPTVLYPLPAPGRRQGLPPRQLALLLSRLATARALQDMSLEAAGAARSWASQLSRALLRGRSLADAMAEQQAMEPTLIAWVRIGEKQGRLGETLADISAFIRRRESDRRRLRQELAYPLLLLTAVTGVGLLLFFVIMPLLARQFTAFDGELPVTLALPLAVQEGIRRHWPVVVVLLSALAMLPLLRGKGSPRAGHLPLRRLPILRRLSILRNYVPFARLFGSLLSGGVPVFEALRDVRTYFAGTEMASRLDAVADDCRSGVEVSRALSRAAFVPPMAAQTLIEAERVGHLSRALLQSADDYEAAVLEELSMAMRFIEPAAVLALGVLIFFLAAGVFLPVLDAYQLAAEAGL